jgi:hypothetical protein
MHLPLFFHRFFLLDDILNVRLQTLGVVEHTFTINMGTGIFKWLVYDVGEYALSFLSDFHIPYTH